ncbi:Aste57867_871 [Aphanomyces stellatus]|uniref:Signal peptidase complex catalytic subunit SEC11 n=1 Tax=Aphanomyces stellatus TaxID=120398 RepID=A0A485K3Q0_9STRA|nr:hypothetical protein As57867_000870 [Aphanomyces stellatus]VFT78095.1 Aste57867_871 [Aphanomyces stellatus]
MQSLARQQAEEVQRLWKNKRQLTQQCLTLGMVVISAIMIWKGLVGLTGGKSPIVVVLTGSMEPAFQRGDILFLDNNKPTIDIGDIVVFTIKDRPIPIVHRVLEIHTRHSDLANVYLTKGDANDVFDRSLYADGQLWIERHDIIGVARASVPYIGYATILMNDYPVLKAVTIAVMAVLAFTQRE